MKHSCPRCAKDPCACDWGDEPEDIQWFGIVFVPTHTPACIVTRTGSVTTETMHRCWACYDVLMLHPGWAASDPAVYHLTCRGCGTQHLANFPEGKVPAWPWASADSWREAEPKSIDEVADDYWGDERRAEALRKHRAQHNGSYRP